VYLQAKAPYSIDILFENFAESSAMLSSICPISHQTQRAALRADFAVNCKIWVANEMYRNIPE